MASIETREERTRGASGRGRAAWRVAAAVLALVALLLVGAVLASRVRDHSGTGPVRLGAVEVEVVDDNATPDFYVNAASSPVARSYHVENVGSESQYVRVRLEVLDAEGNAVEDDDVSARAALGEGSPWCERTGSAADGWYYYRGILAAGAETETLPVQVAFSGGRDSRESYQLVVRVQAVQSKNQAGQNTGHVETVDVLDVEGWPEGE